MRIFEAGEVSVWLSVVMDTRQLVVYFFDLFVWFPPQCLQAFYQPQADDWTRMERMVEELLEGQELVSVSLS